MLQSGPDFGREKGGYLRVEGVLKSKFFKGVQNGYISSKPYVKCGTFPLSDNFTWATKLPSQFKTPCLRWTASFHADSKNIDSGRLACAWTWEH